MAASSIIPPAADSAAQPAIELREISLAFDEKRVLEGISFDVPRGATSVLMGVSGSGKSVLLKVMLGLIKPDSGEVLIEGENITPKSEVELYAFRRRMGIVFQEGALFDSLSVYENVSYRLREDGKLEEDAIEQRVRQVLGFVELEDAIYKMPAELSGGMRRRVAIARAIISHPPIMLYDSPTAGLDPVTAHTIDSLIAKMRDVEHATSIVVTQRIQDALMLSGFVYSTDIQGLRPLTEKDGHHAAEATQFLVLKDAGVYFRGNRQEILTAKDPYLRGFVK